MYEEFFGLNEKPFSLSPDPSCLYLSKNHLRAQTMLEYGVMSQAGFTVITGDIGAGKTTLVHHLLNNVSEDVTFGLINNTHTSFGNLMIWVLDAFDLHEEKADNSRKLRIFTDFVLDQYSEGKRVLLIVDEAQNLTEEMLEELRLLSNINIISDVYLQLMLVGQPELIDKLNKPQLTQVAQRIGVEFNLRAMDFDDSVKYILYRLKCAGVDRELFTPPALAVIFCYSEGIPRRINTLCDMALVYAFADEKQLIEADLIIDMVSDRAITAVIKQNYNPNNEIMRVKAQLLNKYGIELPQAD